MPEFLIRCHFQTYEVTTVVREEYVESHFNPSIKLLQVTPIFSNYPSKRNSQHGKPILHDAKDEHQNRQENTNGGGGVLVHNNDCRDQLCQESRKLDLNVRGHE